MYDKTRFPMLKPELLLSKEPLPPMPAGPVRFALDDWPVPQRPTVLRECLARLGFSYQVDPLPDIPFNVDVTLNMLPGMLVGVGAIHGSRNRRSRKDVDDNALDAILLVNLEGPHLVEQRNRQLVLGDGEAVFVSAADPSSFTHQPPGSVLALRFPKARLEPLLRDPDDCYMRRIPRDSQVLKFLMNYVALAWDDRTSACPDMQHLMVNHIYDLMSVMMGATRDAGEAAEGGGLHAARLHLIKQDIARSLDRPDLTVTALAERHRCTPRFVQRLFEAEGTTFTEYVLEQRLQRAHRRLVDPRRAGEKISTVAYDCGFGDVSYFNRVFRRHYRAAPSDVRAQAAWEVPGPA
ncbi:MAG TPA: AraC family transcriptional regulator [Candidatus Cybelea sp.]|nr:AraC family transcriptional regulator [Candidatus Cybelea sp.]